MAQRRNTFKQRVLQETALFLGLLFGGLVLIPVAIYFVGQQLFGAYGGNGYGDFFGTLSGKIRAGDIVTWFLVLSPYLAWQVLRITAYGWSVASKPRD